MINSFVVATYMLKNEFLKLCAYITVYNFESQT